MSIKIFHRSFLILLFFFLFTRMSESFSYIFVVLITLTIYLFERKTKGMYYFQIRVHFKSSLLCILHWFPCFSSVISFCLEAEKLCTKCAEKFSQETLSIKLLGAQIPLLVTSLEVRLLFSFHSSFLFNDFPGLGSIGRKTQVISDICHSSVVWFSYWTIAVIVQIISSYKFENRWTRTRIVL